MTASTVIINATSDYMEAAEELLPFLRPAYTDPLERRIHYAKEGLRMFNVALESVDFLLAAAAMSATLGCVEIGLAVGITRPSDLPQHGYTDAADQTQDSLSRLVEVSAQQKRIHHNALKAWDRVLGADPVRTDSRTLKRRPGNKYYAEEYRKADQWLRVVVLREFDNFDERVRIVRRGMKSRLGELTERREEEQQRVMALVYGKEESR